MKLLAPFAGTVVSVPHAIDDTVSAGTPVIVLEAMKMEQPITAHKDGTINSVNAAVGATVSSGHVLLNIAD
jgi:acetyl-CoA/propionyl-CoA carboxylase, biotin carboxylase, biotin carboxyl carrier protein